ncbi:alpha-hydroxy acid oxidase [Micromonospora sp. WMMD1082]|uniref:alpha-hydroxy acid oxidase n=1 Tax=Micromonospora sp. WMMD1082 TaxID=3016104 RepID=UPI0024179F2C|nr:alpha-hydroxy acid oxidase [Micromonospora sp. WMMD1082]MDG4794553.1 alpha-hydroxy acid oxidase [Micromonospora sp. WMMD1082]
MSTTRVPSSRTLGALIRPAGRGRDAVQRRLTRVQSIHDLREAARRRAPRAVFDYADGGAGRELNLGRCRQTYDRLEFHPTALTDVSVVDTSSTVLGGPVAFPFALAPTGFTRIMHPSGEGAVASVAEAYGVPYSLSTLGTTTMEDVAIAAPGARRWFQLYLSRDRALAKELLARASASGFDTLLLTVDTPISVNRPRDVHNGLTIPPSMSVRAILDGLRHLGWCGEMFRATRKDPLVSAVLKSTGGNAAEMIQSVFNPTLDLGDLEWLRAEWSGKLVAKGVQSVTDACRAVDAGADGVWLSTHGGRKLDRAPVPLELVPPVVDALQGRADVVVDSGITSGADIVAAVALGASVAAVGRAYLYGLMAGGRTGVDKALEILTGEVVRTMQLLGVTRVDQLRPAHVTLHGWA